jgi:hypothetical protein
VVALSGLRTKYFSFLPSFSDFKAFSLFCRNTSPVDQVTRGSGAKNLLISSDYQKDQGSSLLLLCFGEFVSRGLVIDQLVARRGRGRRRGGRERGRDVVMSQNQLYGAIY